MEVIKIELIKYHFELEADKECCFIKSLLPENFEELVANQNKFISNPPVQAFIYSVQNLLEQEYADLQDGKIIIKNEILSSLDKESRDYLKLPQMKNFKVEISQEGIPGRKSFYFLYSLKDCNQEVHFNRAGCFIQVGSDITLLSKFHYELFETLDYFNNLTAEEKEGVSSWDSILKCKQLSDSVDIVFSQFLDQQNVIIPSGMSFEISEDEKNNLNIKPKLNNINEENNNKFIEEFNSFANAQNSYTYKLDTGEKIRLIIPPEIKENLQVIRQRPKIRTEKEKKLILEKPHSFFPYPDVVSLEDFSDRVIGFGLYDEVYSSRKSSEKDWKFPIIISVKTISNTSVLLEFKDKEELKETQEEIKENLKKEIPYIIIEGQTIPLSPNNLEELKKIFDLSIAEQAQEEAAQSETKSSEVIELLGNDNEKIYVSKEEIQNNKSNIIDSFKKTEEGRALPINLVDTTGKSVNIEPTQENFKIFKKFFEIHLLIDEKEYEFFENFLLEAEIPENNKVLIPEIPSSLKSQFELKKHQNVGLAWLQNCFNLNKFIQKDSKITQKAKWKGVLLADDMGLGKTLQILCFLAWIYENNKINDCKKNRPFLIVAPPILLENWKREYLQFLEPIFGEPLILHGAELKNHRVEDLNNEFKGKEYYQITDEEGNPKTFLKTDLIKQRKLVITNYETLTNYEFSLGKIDWSIIVLDEAQEIKEPKTYKSRIAKALKADFKIACTGTPIENTLLDLWNIFDFLEPGFLHTSSKVFSSTYEDKNMTDEKYSELKNKFYYGKPYSYILRRIKSDELEGLPSKTNEIIPVPLTKRQLDLYNDLKIDMIKNPKSTVGILQQIDKLHQHPRLLESERSILIPTKNLVDDCPKFSKLLDILNGIKQKNEKALIFCLYHQLQTYLKQVIEEYFNLNVSIINGEAHGSKYRQGLIDNFHKDPETFKVLILSPRAAGVGLNITGANHVIHYGRWWNPAIEMQATDRAYRIGQNKDVKVYYLINTFPEESKFQTFDETLHNLLMEKIKLAENFLVPSNVSLEAELSMVLRNQTNQEENLKNKTDCCYIDFNKLNSLDPDNFEAYIACLYDYLGFTTILCPLNFPGADVIAYKNDELRLIQCKHSAVNCLKDSVAVYNILDAKSRLLEKIKVDKSIVLDCITNSDFDKEAYDDARNMGVNLLNANFLKDNGHHIKENLLDLKIMERKNKFSEVYEQLSTNATNLD